MDFSNILFSVLVLGVMGMLFGLALGYASRIFAVKQDERLPLIQDALPGANCGGCGYPGCSNFANAIISGEAPINGCPVGGVQTSGKLAEIMGVEAPSGDRQLAHVYCNGGINAEEKFKYSGLQDCLAAMRVASGPTACSYACVGLGTCVKSCGFGAIDMINGVAVINKEKCTGCLACVSACPKNIISTAPESKIVHVNCSSKDKGAVAKNLCKVSCIGCKICEKKCEFDAIKVVDNLAVIDYDKCTGCMACVDSCPKKSISQNLLDGIGKNVLS